MTSITQEYMTNYDIEKEWENVKSIIKRAAPEALGTKKKNPRRIGLRNWTPEIVEAIQEKQKRYNKDKHNRKQQRRVQESKEPGQSTFKEGPPRFMEYLYKQC